MISMRFHLECSATLFASDAELASECHPSSDWQLLSTAHLSAVVIGFEWCPRPAFAMGLYSTGWCGTISTGYVPHCEAGWDLFLLEYQEAPAGHLSRLPQEIGAQ